MRVIVADDDAVTRMLMASVVEGLGHSCVPVSTGTAALEEYDKSGADVIVTDWLMPGLDGLELCRQVRLYTDRGYAYVVVVSGRSDRADVLSGMRAGADGYLSKPIHFEELEMQLIAAARVTELHRRLSEKQQIMDEELERAAEVQRRLLPRRVPDVPGYDIAGACVPSWSVSGDFFDWYPMRGGVVVTLVDVMGKGMGAAILMATMRAVLRGTSGYSTLAEGVRQAAATLSEDLAETTSFATLFHTRVNAATGEVRYIDAGHGLTCVARHNGEVDRLSTRGLPLGILPDSEWVEGVDVLEPGDALVAFSDGLLDAFGDATNEEELAKVMSAVAAQARTAATSESAVANLTALAADQTDDITVVVVRRCR
jgi:sigma-B regulation protein RsbU (phosphoserine phosphatase)